MPQRLLLPLIGAALIATFAAESSRGEEGARSPSLRRWDAGPLSFKEFRGELPADKQARPGSAALAYTSTDIRFSFQYRFDTRAGRTTVRLTSVDIFAVFLQEESWCTRADNSGLLDHEQGHFDITEIHARRAQAAFDSMFASGDDISAAGRTKKEAVAQLVREIQKRIEPYAEEANDAHKEYDRVTKHGTIPRLQREQRRIQMETLQRLAAQLKRDVPSREATPLPANTRP